MIKIRSNVFETNSSSTHSVCLETGYDKKFTYKNIPENTIVTIPSRYYEQFEDNGVNETEWKKLNLLIDLILDVKIKHSSEKHLCEKYIKILEDVINTEKKSTIKFDFDYKKRSPFYSISGDDIFSLLDFRPNDDAESIYDIFKNFVFNKDVTMRYQIIMN